MFLIDTLIKSFWVLIPGSDTGDGPFDQFFSLFLPRAIFFAVIFVGIFFMNFPKNFVAREKKAFFMKISVVFCWIFMLFLYLSTKNIEKLWLTKFEIHVFGFFIYFFIIIFIILSLFIAKKWHFYDIVDTIMPVFMFVFTVFNHTPRKQMILLIIVFKWLYLYSPILTLARLASSMTLAQKKAFKLRNSSQIEQNSNNLKAASYLLDPLSTFYFILLLSLGIFVILFDFTSNLSAVPSLSVYPPAGRMGIKSDNTFPIPSAIGMASHKFGICVILGLFYWSFSSGILVPKRRFSPILHPFFSVFFDSCDDTLFYSEMNLVFPFDYLCSPHHFSSLLTFSMCALLTIATNNLFYSWYYEVDYEQIFAMTLVVCALSILMSFCNFVAYCGRVRKSKKQEKNPLLE